MKCFFTFLFSLVFTFSFSQIPDTIITTEIYKSYINYNLKTPLFVKYKLYQGGGDCDRTKLRFKNDTKIIMVGNKDYKKSGYDKGHLANAEDFAFNCHKNELTFRLYNCIPQTPNLNRGSFRKDESLIRKISKTDSLLILTGGIFLDKPDPSKSIIPPTYCFKIVKSLTTNEVLYVFLYENNTISSRYSITLDRLLSLSYDDVNYTEYINEY